MTPSDQIYAILTVVLGAIILLEMRDILVHNYKYGERVGHYGPFLASLFGCIMSIALFVMLSIKWYF